VRPRPVDPPEAHPAVDALTVSDPTFDDPAGRGRTDPLASGLPEDAAALGADWGASRRRRSMPAGPRLGPAGWVRWAWRQLTSMRTALVLLFLLALAAIPGSVLPQRSSNPLGVNAWIGDHPGIAPLLDRLHLFDVFASPWFSAIYILLFISLIGCVLPRIGAHWRAMRHPTPPAPRRMDRLAGARTWTTTEPDVLARATSALRRERWRITAGAETQGSVGSIAAERGFARETGNLLFHVALVLVLVGVATGSLFGWKGTVIVREGSGFSNTLTQYDSFSPGRLASPDDLPPFSFTMTDFEATFEREGSQRGAPRSFAATLEYRAEPGAEAQQREVSVNAPLRVDGAKVFLVGHGYAPHLRVTDSTGRVVFDDTVVFLPQDGNFTSTGVVKAPDASPPLGLQALFLPTAALDAVRGPHSTFPAPDDPALFVSAFTGDLGLDDGQPRNVFTLDTASLEQIGLEALRPGESWTLPGGQGSVELVDYGRWASFTIAYDPGKGLALAAAITAIVGLSLSLFVRRRRIWVRVAPIGSARQVAATDPPEPQVAPGAGHDDAPAVGGRDPGATADASDGAPDSAAGPGTATVYRVQVAGLSRTDSTDVADEVDQLVARIGGPRTEEAR
jgi:cytochrome c biogenesis protein